MKFRPKRQRNWSNQSRFTIKRVSIKQPIAKRNIIVRFGKLVELDPETGLRVIPMFDNVTRDDKRARSKYDSGN